MALAIKLYRCIKSEHAAPAWLTLMIFPSKVV